MSATRRPLVSVIIPTFNRAELLAGAIESALRQTAAAYCEVIVVNDGGADETPRVVRGFGSDVRYIEQPNAGLAAARNAGIRASRGAFVALLDDDDRWLPEKIAAQLLYITQHRRAALVTTRSLNVRPGGAATPRRLPDIPLNTPFDALPCLLRTNFIPPSSVLTRRSALDAVGLFRDDLRQAEDLELWSRLAGWGPFLCLGEPLTLYSASTPGSLSGAIPRQLGYELRARRLMRAQVRSRPDCRAAWRHGFARLLASLRDDAYRRERYMRSAYFGVRSLLTETTRRPRWEWARPLDALGRALTPRSGGRFVR